MDQTLTSAKTEVSKRNIFKILWNRPSKKLRSKDDDIHSGYKASGRKALDVRGNNNSRKNEEICGFREERSKKGKFREEFTKAKVKKSCKEKQLRELKVQNDSRNNGANSTEKIYKNIYLQSTDNRTENVANFKKAQKENFAKAGQKTSGVKEEGSMKPSIGWRQFLCFPIFRLFRSASRKRRKRLVSESIEVVEQDQEMHLDDMIYVMRDACSDEGGKRHGEMDFCQQQKRQQTPLGSIAFENSLSDEYKDHEEINQTFSSFNELSMEKERRCGSSDSAILDERHLEQFNENTLSKSIWEILEHQLMSTEEDELLYDNCRKADTDRKLPFGITAGFNKVPIASSYESIVASSEVLYETGGIASDIKVASEFAEMVNACNDPMGLPLHHSGSFRCASEGVPVTFQTESPIAIGNFQTVEKFRKVYSDIMDGDCNCKNEKVIMQEEEICSENCRRTVLDEGSSLEDSAVFMGEIPFDRNIEIVNIPWCYSATPSSNLMYEAYGTGSMPFNFDRSSAFGKMIQESEIQKATPVQTSSGFCVSEFESITLERDAPITSGSFHMEENLPEHICEIVYEEFEYLYEIEIEKEECLFRGYEGLLTNEGLSLFN